MGTVTKLTPKTDKSVLIFGDHDEWAVSVDDGCLMFHPNFNEHPEIKATHIWRGAWEFVESQGGFAAVRDKILALYQSNEGD